MQRRWESRPGLISLYNPRTLSLCFLPRSLTIRIERMKSYFDRPVSFLTNFLCAAEMLSCKRSEGLPNGWRSLGRAQQDCDQLISQG